MIIKILKLLKKLIENSKKEKVNLMIQKMKEFLGKNWILQEILDLYLLLMILKDYNKLLL